MSPTRYGAAPPFMVDLGRAKSDPEYCIYDGDDFQTVPITTEGYTITTDAGGSQVLDATQVGGVLKITNDGDDNDETVITRAPVAGCFKCTLNSGSPVQFKCRVKFGTYVTQSLFIGMAEEAVGADFLVDGGTGIGAFDAIGFQSLEASSTELDAIYKLSTGSTVQCNAAADGDNIDTIETSYFHTYSFYFDGKTTIIYYVDDVEVCRDENLTATTFPTGEELQFAVAVKAHDAVAPIISVDWWWGTQQGVSRGRYVA